MSATDYHTTLYQSKHPKKSFFLGALGLTSPDKRASILKQKCFLIACLFTNSVAENLQGCQSKMTRMEANKFAFLCANGLESRAAMAEWSKSVLYSRIAAFAIPARVRLWLCGQGQIPIAAIFADLPRADKSL